MGGPGGPGPQLGAPSSPNPYGAPGQPAPGPQQQAPGGYGAPAPGGPDVSGMLAAIDQEKFASKKVEIFGEHLNRLPGITSAQAREVVSRLSYASDQLVVIERAWPKVLDRQNFQIVVDSLKYESDKQAIRQKLGIQ